MHNKRSLHFPTPGNMATAMASISRVASFKTSVPALNGRRARRNRVVRVGASGGDGLYSGGTFFHIYEKLTDPKPIFNTFLEGALHATVGRRGGAS